ncbi:GMC family oxidoreductase [Blastomonas sp.]|uniref:GMC family oxidoreductase n=1 Tax=Blastomonas sp. TaxID=1909299 RepID=UPI00406A92C8
MSETFDYIIVGAGSAGCVLANRLSRDDGARVLLLEAGGRDRHPLISIPVGAAPMLRGRMFQWADSSEPDPTLMGRRQWVPHGRVLGGTSSINFFAATRGHPADYDRWAEAGAHGWDHKSLAPFFKEIEHWCGPPDPRRGSEGEVGIVASASSDPIMSAWFDAVAGQGGALNSDYNANEQEGFGWLQFSIRDGRRSSSAHAFLRPAMRRRNLTVRTGAHAKRIIVEKQRARGIDYLQNGKIRRAEAAVRLILCLGAINTPHLLLLSGIGPAEHLGSMGLPVIADLPVGLGLQDHLAVETGWTRNDHSALHASLRIDRLGVSMLRAGMLRSGPGTRLPGVLVGFERTAPALRQPDIEYLLNLAPPHADRWWPGRPYRDGYGIRVQLMSQRSTGRVSLRSTDPMDRPRIEYQSLADPHDLATLREGLRRAIALGNAPELAPFRGEQILPAPINTDDELDDFIRQTAAQQYHPASTCRMGTGAGTVVDPELNVHGVDRLGIVDASVMPHLVSGHPNLPTMAMAAKAAAHWLGDHPSYDKGDRR